MGYKAITQIALTAIALIIVFTYIKPTLLSIKATQDELYQYEDTLNKATELNNRLAELISIEESYGQNDYRALEAFLPSAVDSMQVMADIDTIAKQSGVDVTSLSAEDPVVPKSEVSFEGEEVIESDETGYTDFKLEVSGTYESFKELLSMIERNKYILEFQEISFGDIASDEKQRDSSSADSTQEGSVEGAYTLVLRAYSYSQETN